MRIFASGKDQYCLQTLEETEVRPGIIETIQCTGILLDSIHMLPKVEAQSVILLDGSGQAPMEVVLLSLRNHDWTYVVVAADPLTAQASTIFRKKLAHDYWVKSYAISQKLLAIITVPDET